MAGVDGSGGTKFLLMGTKDMEFSKSIAMLADPNVFIADMGAMVHMSSSKVRAVNIQKVKMDDCIMMGNEALEGAFSYMDIEGTLCNKHGNEKGKAML